MVDGKEVDADELYNTPATRSMFEDTLNVVTKATATNLGRRVTLGHIACPQNLSPTTHRIVNRVLFETHIPDCLSSISSTIQSNNEASGMVNMDNTRTRRRYTGTDLEPVGAPYWYIITVAVYPEVIQVLVAEGDAVGDGHGWIGHKCVKGMDVSTARKRHTGLHF